MPNSQGPVIPASVVIIRQQQPADGSMPEQHFGRAYGWGLKDV
jgi:hypothetical protein